MAKKDTPETPEVMEVPADPIRLQPIKLQTVELAVVGVTGLIVHRFDEKAKRIMLEAQQTRGTRAKKEPKDPEGDYKRSLYRLPDGREGFPAPGFKAAIVGACRHFDGISMVQAKQALIVLGEGPEQLTPIFGTSKLREDAVRVGMGTADLRYRGHYDPWGTVLTIRFMPSVLDTSSIVALVNAAGFGGVGEWRPSAPKSSTGSFGMFQVFDGDADQLRAEIGI